MNTFYNEIADHFQGYLRDDVIDAIEAACITEGEWTEDQEDCIGRIHGALEEFYNFDFEDGPSEDQEWYDFDPEC
jgi:hypothetical protein